MRGIGIAAGLVTVAFAALSGCGRGATAPDGSGTIECVEVDVASVVSGRLLEAAVDEGAFVREDDVIALIDPSDHTLRRDEADAALEYAQAQLDLLLAGPRAEDVERARQQALEAEAAARVAESDRARIERLHAAGSASDKQLDDARALGDRAQATLAAARQVLEKLEAGSTNEELRVARAVVRQAEAKLAVATKAVSDCTIRSPLDGIVTTRSREAGEFVTAGSVVAAVSDPRDAWLSIYVPGARLAGVVIGQPARVRVDGETDFREGTVSFVSPEAEFTPRDVQTPDERAKLVYRVKIKLPNADGILKPGMAADGYLDSRP